MKKKDVQDGPKVLTDEDLRKISGGVRTAHQLAPQVPGEVAGGEGSGECDRCILDAPRRKD